MDGKNAQILDPKLKEAYDRVMGASVPPPTAKPTPPPLPETHQAAPVTPMHPDAPMPATPHAAGPATPAHTAPTHTPVAFSSAYVAPHEEKKSGVSTPLLVIAGVIFFVIYTLFCMKAFGMAIPFLE